MKRWHAALAAASALAIIGAAVPPLSASAATGKSSLTANKANYCYQYPGPGWCNDTDPVTTGCAADAYTVDTAVITDYSGTEVGYVELRYSPHCGTNWARITGVGPGIPDSKEDFVCLYPSDGGCSAPDYGSDQVRYSDQEYAATTPASAQGYINAGNCGGGLCYAETGYH